MIPNLWCSLEVAATELHLCFVIKGNVWWKRTFLRMVTIAVLHHKHTKLFTPFTPHVIARVAILAFLSQKPQIWLFLKAFGFRMFFWLFVFFWLFYHLSLILCINLNFLTKYLCLIKLHSDQFCY